jgi:predicted O-methyltransferase YrrM
MTPLAATETKKNLSREEKHALGVRLLASGRAAEASPILKEVLDECPSSDFANDWAVAELALGHAANAKQGFTQALALDADNVEAATNLGILLASRRRPQEAIPLLEEFAARVENSQRAAVMQVLNHCRIQAAAITLRETKAVFRDVRNKLERPASPVAADDAGSEFWFPDITGWFSRADALHLYTAIKLTRPRRILEIGTFYGRSTATICTAIKSLGTCVDFITIDLDLRSEEQAKKIFGEIHGIDDIPVSEQFKEAFELGFSTTEYAEYQIRKHRLSQYVTFESGDFRNLPGEFDLVFADVMHEPVEIRKNLPAILRKLSPDGILVVHDLNDANKQVIESIADTAEFISQSETLGIFRIHGKASPA